MRFLKIPYLPVLNPADLLSAGAVMAADAAKLPIDTVNWVEYPYLPAVKAELARSAEFLFIRFIVLERTVKAVYVEDGSPVHDDSCVEFFVKMPDSPYYMNFEFNCIGACDASRRITRSEKTPLTSMEYSSIYRYSSFSERAAFAEKDSLQQWFLTVAIPFRLLGIAPEALPEKIMANFYKCADDTSHPHYVSWNPIDLPSPNFHCPEFFGELFL